MQPDSHRCCRYGLKGSSLLWRGLFTCRPQCPARWRAGVALHGLLSAAQALSNAADAVSLSEQLVHLRVVQTGALGELPSSSSCWDCGSPVFGPGDVGSSGAQAAAMACDATFYGLGDVLPEVESVGDTQSRPPGCAANQPASIWAPRQGSNSSDAPVSQSIRTVP